MELYVFRSQHSKFVKDKQTKCLIGLSASAGAKNYSLNVEMAILSALSVLSTEFEGVWLRKNVSK